MQKGILALLLCLLTAHGASAQPASADVVADIEEAYRQLDYDEAAAIARNALDNYGDFTVRQLAEIHTFLALIAYNRGELAGARRQFLSALQLAPDLELDPILVPPKIQQYFSDIRSEQGSAGQDVAEVVTRYVLVRDPRPEAALRSMLLPGWGQLHKGHSTKAYAFAGLFGASAAGAVLAHVRRSHAKDRYEAASTVREAVEFYGPYNAWHRARAGFIRAGALVWAVSYVDALLTGGLQPESRTISVRADPSAISVRLRF